VRATPGTAIQQTNCHPFRYGSWLFVHNGVMAGFELMRCELMLAVDPELFAGIKGSTDSEVLFHLALTFRFEHVPIDALELAIGLVEATAVRHGIENAVQVGLGVTDGTRLCGFRYSTDRRSRTLFVCADAHAVRQLYPSNKPLQRLHDEDREAAVFDALIADDRVHAGDVDVQVKDGAVTLRGIVELEAQPEIAERIVMASPV
jgi:hypothetical protein